MTKSTALVRSLLLLSLVSAAQADTFYSDDFSSNLGWSLGPKWEIGSAAVSPPGVGSPDPDTDHTLTLDNGVLGADIGGNIGGPDGLHDFWWATSASINLSGATTANLEFWRWLNSDYDPYMTSAVEGWNGTAWEVIWTTTISGTNPFDSVWTHVSYDITSMAAGNSDFKVRFGWDVTSGGVYTISGWNVDDLSITGDSVPDQGATSILLGMGLVAMAAAVRRRSR